MMSSMGAIASSVSLVVFSQLWSAVERDRGNSFAKKFYWHIRVERPPVAIPVDLAS
jgi:hypothetical protein